MSHIPDQRCSRRRTRAGGASWLVAAGTAVALAAGCSSGQARVTAPPIKASRAASEAVRLCDRDRDGAVSPAEATASPGLAVVFEQVDADHDGKLSAEEIAARIASWAQRGVGIVTQPVQIMLNGKPLAGGHAEFVPEPYLARWLKPAESDIAPNGMCSPSLPPADLPAGLRAAVHCGFYTVRITHPQLKLPAQYNEQSTLGFEIRPDHNPLNPLRIDLETRAERGAKPNPAAR